MWLLPLCFMVCNLAEFKPRSGLALSQNVIHFLSIMILICHNVPYLFLPNVHSKCSWFQSQFHDLSVFKWEI